MQYKKILLILGLSLLLVSCFAAKPKALAFDNPGSKRVLKNESGSFYYYRSLPEKSMKLNVAGIDKIELRSFATTSVKKPQVISIIDKKQTTYNLKASSRSGEFHLYESVIVPIPKDTRDIQILCYDRNIYFRAFYTPAPKPKTPAKKAANLNVETHNGILAMTHNGSSSDYYSFTPEQPLRFVLNNKRNAIIYVRARLLDKTIPAFDVYVNGELVQTHELSLKRTTTYSVTGIRHLTTGKKIELPTNDGRAVVELRAKSQHLFLGRPVLTKSN